MRFSEYYKEDNSQQADRVIAPWMKCVRVTITWKVHYRKWKLVLQLEWSVLQWTFYGRYFTECGQWYCSLNEVRCSEYYMAILHSRWTVVLQLEWSALLWTLYGRYFADGGNWYSNLNDVRCSEHYIKDTSQHVDTAISAWIMCVTIYIVWKINHSMWTLVFQPKWRAFQWTLCGSTSQQVDNFIAA